MKVTKPKRMMLENCICLVCQKIVCKRCLKEKVKDGWGRLYCPSCTNLATTHPLYGIWNTIKQKCFNPNYRDYVNYGALGRSMFNVWRYDFLEFVKYIEENLGPKPSPDHSLERINNDVGYFPDNLRWATKAEQAINKRTSLVNRKNYSLEDTILYNNKTITLALFSEIVSLDPKVTLSRANQCKNAEWILSKNKYRKHLWKGNLYSRGEISLICGVPPKKIYERMKDYRWTLEQAMFGKNND
jgi:hypothetical protein